MTAAKTTPVAIMIATLLGFSAPATADTFKVHAKDLNGRPIPFEDGQVTAQVFKMDRNNNTLRLTPPYQINADREAKLTEPLEAGSDADGGTRFDFTLDANDSRLTGNDPDVTDRMVMLVFTRDGLETAVLPFVAISSDNSGKHDLFVTVPRAGHYGPPAPEPSCGRARNIARQYRMKRIYSRPVRFYRRCN